ncbi:helix-turn-helix transcriptional regulator [Burkholderia latens]|uniref:helix-turn-helix transcriptional regulator n=1 Tax=Burkholderia latens TaxID=488446 RepID=UPI001AE2488E|nr:AlpA family phage regulatory protein [Burkholderia latens]QTO42419.1 AlpA family phage regulatory protein [Burkholderia latens]
MSEKLILRGDEVCAMLGLVSTQTLVNLGEKGMFPKRIKIGSLNGWIAEEVYAWLEERKAERKNEGGAQ